MRAVAVAAAAGGGRGGGAGVVVVVVVVVVVAAAAAAEIVSLTVQLLCNHMGVKDGHEVEKDKCGLYGKLNKKTQCLAVFGLHDSSPLAAASHKGPVLKTYSQKHRLLVRVLDRVP